MTGDGTSLNYHCCMAGWSKSIFPTRPPPARQDAPFREQGRSERSPRRYNPHFVRAVRPLNWSWRTEKPLKCFRHPTIVFGTLRVWAKWERSRRAFSPSW